MRIEDALNATRAANEEGIVPGGGVALVRVQQKLSKMIETTTFGSDDEKIGFKILTAALDVPLRSIAYNSGAKADVVIDTVMSHDAAYGYDALNNEYNYVYDRSQVRQKRDSKEIGISAVRAGTIVGEHEVIFAGTDEVIEFKHTAYSRSVFGKGAVEAAKYLAGKPAGMYDMSDVIAF